MSKGYLEELVLVEGAGVEGKMSGDYSIRFVNPWIGSILMLEMSWIFIFIHL